MTLGNFQVIVSNLVDVVVAVMLDKMTQLSVVCLSVCLDLKWIEIVWYVSVLTLEMPYINACVWVMDNLKRSTNLSIMKCDWEALSNNALHGMYWPELFWNSTMAVESKIWILGSPWMNNKS